MLLTENTYKNQSALASYCRTGKLTPIQGINHDNITHYRRLVYNVVDDMLQSAYPLTYNLFTEREWEKTVDDFFANHPCQSPQVWYMPKEFYKYIIETKNPVTKKYPFLEELLLFEWTELELYMMEDLNGETANRGNIQFDSLLLNPEHKFLQFSYPVHKKAAKEIKESDRGNFFLVGYRHPGDYNVLFTELSPALAKMFGYIEKEPATLNGIIERFQKEFNMALNENDRQSILEFFENARSQRLIISSN
jgi:hypothetical protein